MVVLKYFLLASFGVETWFPINHLPVNIHNNIRQTSQVGERSSKHRNAGPQVYKVRTCLKFFQAPQIERSSSDNTCMLNHPGGREPMSLIYC